LNHVGNEGNGGADARNTEGHKNDAGGGKLRRSLVVMGVGEWELASRERIAKCLVFPSFSAADV
jgi:hypothetical protein